MGRMATRTPRPTTGTLQIGDQWNAITIIAHSQTHPLKAICELVENAIDAGARSVRIIRRRHRGQTFIAIEDDGRGVAPDASGRPDFERIATHLCDSMKRQLDARGRQGVHGEFGIGLLSFWSLGEELRMMCAGSDGKAFELHLERGRREYVIRPVRGLLASGGTRVTVGPLLDSTRNLVTGDKIARYLSAELRDRIRRTGASMVVVDRLTHREIPVVPREFDGDPLDLPRRYPTPLGDVQVEIYARAGTEGSGGIALCKDGTRVLRDIAELLPFQQAPWTDSRLEGLIDFERIALAPGTRSGVVADAALEALVVIGEAIARDVNAALEKVDSAESERASRQILRQVHKAFTSALADLPPEDYLFFDVPKPGDAAAAGGRGEVFPEGADSETGVPPGSRETVLFPPEAGPLAAVRIVPRHPRKPPGGEATLRAVARDTAGVAVTSGVSLHWRLVSGTAWLTADTGACRVRADAVGLAVVEVTARQGEIEVTDTVEVKFTEDAGDGATSRGLPSYRLEAEHGRPWRSRYEPASNEIVINSAHRDFSASRSSTARHRRYIGKLYAKEVVLSNFPHESPAEALERFVEITFRTDDSL
jgi:hypothetical protein